MPSDVLWPVPQAPKPNLPRPALGNPSLERAMDALRKTYPQDMSGVDIVPDWSPKMVTGTNGFIDRTQPNTIHVNALKAALAPQDVIEGTAAHELEHVRQTRDPDRRARMTGDFTLPYEERRTELEAQDAAQRYRAQRGRVPGEGILPGIYEDTVNDVRKSPAVKELINWLNTR